MSDGFSNVYEDSERAGSYASLEFPGTYYLAYRDLPEIIAKHAKGHRALDFGCGAGRSTRFLKKLGFEAVGVDISEQMISLAMQLDPEGDYRVSGEYGPTDLPVGAFDLVQSVFTFDNVPMAAKATLFASLRRLLKPTGKLVSLVSTPEIYTHDWASFRTTHFESNFKARSGDTVYTVMLDVEDQRPVSDVFCLHEDYERFYKEAGLKIEATYKPLGREDEPIAWVNETRVAPWIIYVLAPLPA